MIKSTFEAVIREHATRYPKTRPRDAVKLCYQACFGSGHLFEDTAGTRDLLLREYTGAEAETGVLFEPLPGGFARMNLGAAKNNGFPPELVYKLFAATAEMPPSEDAAEHFRELLSLVSQLAEKGLYIFSRAEFDEYTASYLNGTEIPPPVSHSNEYRATYNPRYRVVDKGFEPLMGLCCAIYGLPERERTVVAFEGRCASGKSTAAELLARTFGAEIVRCDDFFLPPVMRTPERHAQPGGNIHYERFSEEVILKLRRSEPFGYGVYDCGEGRITRVARVGSSRIVIVEGAYAMHPRFGRYYDLAAFFDVDSETQRKRVIERNGEDAWQSFKWKWIPFEEAYITATNADKRAEIIVRV